VASERGLGQCLLQLNRNDLEKSATTNADVDFSDNATLLFNQIYQLSGSKIAPFYSPIVVDAKLDDRWYTIDFNSTETMMTVQGLFAISVTSPPAVASPVAIPIIFTYEVEFMDPALQQNSISKSGIVMPNFTVGTFSSTSNPLVTVSGNWPNYVANQLYAVIPSFAVNDITGIDSVSIYYVVPLSGGGASQLNCNLYATIDDYESGVIVKYVGIGVPVGGSTTWYPVN
jgi:hypothetical protein